MNYPKINQVIEVIAKLRDPKYGCPWDLKQNHKSLLKYLVEESYEYIEAVEENDFDKMKDELGDVLLQVLLHSQIAQDNNKFSIEDVADNLSKKMVRRHPHVFTDQYKNISEEEIIKNWEQIKKEEKKEDASFYYSQKDLNLPSLSSSYKIGKKSNKVNFDWENYEEVIQKVEEELQEVKEELKDEIDQVKVEEEIGDLLFSVSQLSRHLNVDPEKALRDANKKFIKRFNLIEESALQENKSIQDYSREELERLWIKAKKNSL